MKREEILYWLRDAPDDELHILWRRADEARRREVGDAVHLRGLVEISNQCIRQCHYCGLRAGNRSLTRYRMTDEEILECARTALDFGYGTVVLQAGEDPLLSTERISALVRDIKRETGLALTLSLGERGFDELAAWREAGADRYLLRFESSNPALYRSMHPPMPGMEGPTRIAILRELARLGYEVGSGFLIGVPGQTYEDLARDIELCRDLHLDMIGVGPFIPHPDTPLGRTRGGAPREAEDQVPGTELMTYKSLALLRLARPDANIPSTTALATLNLAEGRELGLQCGANVLMPNLTPPEYRAHYEIYPAKACIRETAEKCRGCMSRRIESIGRRVSRGAAKHAVKQTLE